MVGRAAALMSLLITLSALPATADDAPAPRAAAVVARGRAELADALTVAGESAWGDASVRRPVALVVDVTPRMAHAATRIRGALSILDEEERAAASWLVAPLGGGFGPPEASAAALADQIDVLLRTETTEASTVGALRRSLAGLPVSGAVLVYLADRRFEDDAGLESLIKDLKRRDVTLSVIGPEAAFGRGFEDGYGAKDGGTHTPGIGRNPFRGSTDAAPWHGGDTAYPHRPYRWHAGLWRGAFFEADWDAPGLAVHRTAPGGAVEPGGLLPGFGEMSRDEPPGGDEPPPEPEEEPSEWEEEAEVARPIPSGFGPYGLMRAAGATGGRYVLFAWGPTSSRGGAYEDALLDQLAPDLRARKAILASVRENPLATALAAAWGDLAKAKGDLVAHTAPLAASGRGASSVDSLASRGGIGLRFDWPTQTEHRAFLRAAPKAIATLDQAAARLEKGIAGARDAPRGLRARYEADVRYLLHVIHVVRFEVSEALAGARHAPDDAWDRADRPTPATVARDWILPGRDPDAIRTVDDHEPTDQPAGQRIQRERATLLARFRGTPYAEELALNPVRTFWPNWW